MSDPTPIPRPERAILTVVETVGVPELLIILAVVLLVFGSKKVPELARSLGQATREFRKGTRDEDEQSNPHASSN